MNVIFIWISFGSWLQFYQGKKYFITWNFTLNRFPHSASQGTSVTAEQFVNSQVSVSVHAMEVCFCAQEGVHYPAYAEVPALIRAETKTKKVMPSFIQEFKPSNLKDTKCFMYVHKNIWITTKSIKNVIMCVELFETMMAWSIWQKKWDELNLSKSQSKVLYNYWIQTDRCGTVQSHMKMW